MRPAKMVALAAASFLVFLSVSAFGKGIAPNVARARLNLAWDSYEQGRYREALDYLPATLPKGELAREGFELKYDSMLALLDFEKALVLLASASGIEKDEKTAYAEDLAHRWIGEAVWREDYAEARRAAGLLGRLFTSSNTLSIYEKKIAFRSALVDFVRSGGREASFDSGERAFIGRTPPSGEGWVRVFPVERKSAHLIGEYPEEWMPLAAKALGDEGLSLYLKAGEGVVERILEVYTRDNGTGYDPSSCEFFIRDAQLGALGKIAVDSGELSRRGMAEGVGTLGIALEYLDYAQRSFDRRIKLVKWLDSATDGLRYSIEGPNLILARQNGRRKAELEVPLVDALLAEGLEVFGDISRELSSDPLPYACYCGRNVSVREAVAPGGEGKPYSVEYMGVCQNHYFRITPEVRRAWGVSEKSLGEVAKAQSESDPPELYFNRASGGDTLCFAGYGASAIALDPPRLLKLLESVEGMGYRNSEVNVGAPTPFTLMVRREAAGKPFTGEDELCAMELSRRFPVRAGPLGYLSRVSLPARGTGSFNLKVAK